MTQPKTISLTTSVLEACADQTVSVITADGRILVGCLKGFDHATNVILDDCHERVYSMDQPVEIQRLGLYIIRGENIAVINEIDTNLDRNLDLENCRAPPLKPVKH